MTSGQRPNTRAALTAIGVFKLLKAALLLVVAMGLHRLMTRDATDVLMHLARGVRVDPDNRWIHALLSRLTGLSHRQLEAVRLGTLLYAALFAVEGCGLLLRLRWAEWLTVVTTAGLLPLEIYELVHRWRWVKVVVLGLNVAILGYLIWRLRSRREKGKRNEPAAAGETQPR